MSKKIILSKVQIEECLKMYNEDLLGSSAISEKLKIHKTIIIRTLKENGVSFGPSGRRYIGGKSVSDKRNYHKHKTKKSNYYKNWSKNNGKYLRDKHAKWRDENREKINENARIKTKERRKNDPCYRLKCNTRAAVWTCLKERNVAKYRSTFDILGYSLDELMLHLEKQFKDGMTWDNYGQWHVDHKIPMASFKFTTIQDDEFKKCWSLDNLQPLWGSDNLSKGCKIN